MVIHMSYGTFRELQGIVTLACDLLILKWYCVMCPIQELVWAIPKLTFYDLLFLRCEPAQCTHRL